jgi:hypothetical protein
MREGTPSISLARLGLGDAAFHEQTAYLRDGGGSVGVIAILA